MKLDPRHLIVLATIVEEGSFTRAGEVLGVAQPALSKTVAYLETRLGQSLFVRRRRPVEPSNLGRVLAMHGAQLRSILDDAGQAVEQMALGRRGTLRIGAPPFFGEEVLPQLAIAFQREHPRVGFELVSVYAPELRERVATRKLDLALGPLEGAPSVPGLRQRHLVDIHHAVIAASGRDIPAGADLSRVLGDAQWISHSPRSILQAYTQNALAQIGVTRLRSIVVSDSSTAVISMLLATDAFTVLPVVTVLPQLRAGQIKIVAYLPELPVVSFGAVTHHSQDGNVLVERFLDFARTTFATLSAEAGRHGAVSPRAGSGGR